MKLKSDTRTFEGLTVYVDPQAGYIYIKVVTGETGFLKLAIKNQTDKIVAEQSIPANQLTSVPLTGLEQGIYSVHVQINNTELSEKFRF
jgi:inner membrane protein involved in colicin E2 resistance